MKGITGYIIAAVVLALAGVAAFAVASFERDMAAAEESLATLQYDQAADQLAAAAKYAESGRWVPRAGEMASRDLRSHTASLQYWQKQYDALLPREADPVGAVEGEDTSLQLVVANGAYRAGQARAKDKESTMQALDEAVGGYLTVLKGDTWDARAAYNYEYLARLRAELAKGRGKATAPPPPESLNASLGTAGAPAKTSDTKKFEVYIPLEGAERNTAANAGKATPNKRKG
jgi:hypothetical protein